MLLIEYHEMLLHQLFVTFKKGDFLQLFHVLIFTFLCQSQKWFMGINMLYFYPQEQRNTYIFFLLKL